jgi:hypothetical protein
MSKNAVLPIERDTALVPVEQASSLALVIERLASNPAVDVAKLEKIIELQERVLGHQAKAEYFAAFAQMQGELPEISERGEISVNGQVRGRYARFEDIQTAIRPVLQKHGFALSFRMEFPNPTTVKVIGVLAHRAGHAETTEFMSLADTSGSKNAIQALGSSQSYGQRYVTNALLNIVSRGQDDDGRTAEPAKVTAPEGFDDWWEDLQTVAEQGSLSLKAAWEKSSSAFRSHLTKHHRDAWEAIKRAAAKVSA